MPRAQYLLAVILAVPGIGWSQNLSPGLWQISVQSQTAGIPMAMAPMQLSQCLTAADAKDPTKLLGAISSPGASGCTYSDKRYSADKFHFAMECSGEFALKSTGDVSFTVTTVSGTIDTTATLGGQATEVKSSVAAQRIGECVLAQ